MRKHSRLRQFFFKLYNFLMGYYIILYNILLLFGGLFISGGLRPSPKWPIVSTGPSYKMFLELFFFFFFKFLYFFILKGWTLLSLICLFFRIILHWRKHLCYDYHSKGHCGQSKGDWIVLKGRHVTIVVYKFLEYLGPFHIEFSYWEFLSCWELSDNMTRKGPYAHGGSHMGYIYIYDKSLVIVFV